MEADDIKRTIKGFRDDAERILRDKQERRENLGDYIEKSEQKKSELDDKLDTITNSLEEKVEEKDQSRAKIDEELKEDDRYIRTKGKADQAQVGVEQNKKRLEAFQEDASNKLEAYQGNKLFMYLVNRDYGSSQQKGNKITRFLDSNIAKIVNFGENKRNYDFLKSMPSMIQEKVEFEQQELEKLVSSLKETEGLVETKYGLPKIIEEGTALGKERQEIMASIERVDIAHDEYVTELDSLENKTGAYHQKALGRLSDYLEGQTISQLRRKAKQTPSQKDDGIVDRIETLNGNISSALESITSLEVERKKVSNNLKGLKQIKRKFTGNDYESRRSRFNGSFDMNNLLTGYLLGRHSVGDINRSISRAQNFKPRPSSYSSGYSSSSSLSSFGGGGFGGGGFGGGGFGGGGFSTGGGF